MFWNCSWYTEISADIQCSITSDAKRWMGILNLVAKILVIYYWNFCWLLTSKKLVNLVLSLDTVLWTQVLPLGIWKSNDSFSYILFEDIVGLVVHIILLLEDQILWHQIILCVWQVFGTWSSYICFSDSCSSYDGSGMCIEV